MRIQIPILLLSAFPNTGSSQLTPASADPTGKITHYRGVGWSFPQSPDPGADAWVAAKSFTAGAFAGAIGLVVGGFAGYAAEVELRKCSSGGYLNLCGLGGALLGAAVGEIVGIGWGAYAGAGRRDWVRGIVPSALIAAAGIGILAAMGNEDNAGVILSATAAAQLIGTVVTAMQRGG